MKLKFFEICRKLALKSTHPVHHHGALIVYKNRKILGLGFNQQKTHPKASHPYKFLHAEVSALLSTEGESLKNCSVYIYRETKDKRQAMSRPCASCMKTLKEAGIQKIYYTVDNGYLEEDLT